MIEVAILPLDPLTPCRPAFEPSHNLRHPFVARKRQQRVQMVRHEQEQVAVPESPLMIIGGRAQ